MPEEMNLEGSQGKQEVSSLSAIVLHKATNGEAGGTGTWQGAEEGCCKEHFLLLLPDGTRRASPELKTSSGSSGGQDAKVVRQDRCLKLRNNCGVSSVWSIFAELIFPVLLIFVAYVVGNATMENIDAEHFSHLSDIMLSMIQTDIGTVDMWAKQLAKSIAVVEHEGHLSALDFDVLTTNLPADVHRAAWVPLIQLEEERARVEQEVSEWAGRSLSFHAMAGDRRLMELSRQLNQNLTTIQPLRHKLPDSLAAQSQFRDSLCVSNNISSTLPVLPYYLPVTWTRPFNLCDTLVDLHPQLDVNTKGFLQTGVLGALKTNQIVRTRQVNLRRGFRLDVFVPSYRCGSRVSLAGNAKALADLPPEDSVETTPTEQADGSVLSMSARKTVKPTPVASETGDGSVEGPTFGACPFPTEHALGFARTTIDFTSLFKRATAAAEAWLGKVQSQYSRCFALTCCLYARLHSSS
jgi:hypothetical protein